MGDVIFSPEGIGFEIVDQLGKGTFGQVLKCVNISDRSQSVAIKIVKNKPAYFQQGLVEVRILQVLNKSFDLRVVKMLDYFVFRKHLCIVFELLSVNLYDVIKHNNFRGLPYSMVRSIVDQLTRQLVCLKLCNVVHCDLKPENILLTTKRNTKIKLIDFGSAAFEGQQIYTYIQSRFYRSVDVILGFMPFTPAIDMWSLGCILAELFLGLPLFPGHSEYDQLCRIVELMGPIPDELLERGKNTRKFFVRAEQPRQAEHTGAVYRWRLRSRDEYEEATGKKEKIPKKLNKASSLRELVFLQTAAKPDAEDTLRREKILSFINFCLEYDPVKRITPVQAIAHPLFDDAAGLEATRTWRPRPDEYCKRKLAEDPNSFIYHSSGAGGPDASTLVDVSATLTATPVKPGLTAGPQPLQSHNYQRPVSSMADEALSAVSYRPALAKPPSHSSPSKQLVTSSPTTVLRGGIPFSPGTNRLPPPTAYFSPIQRPRAHSNI